MFFILSKRKIYSYLIALSTVVILFVSVNFIQGYSSIQTSSRTTRLIPIYSVDTKEKEIALTINCAWNADDIDTILDILEETQTTITFFVVGDWVDKYSDYVKKIADKGHEIANHSNTHPHVNNLSYEKNIEEIQKCNEKIKKITGKNPYLYRGPYGEYNDTVIKAVESLNMKTIQWSLDTLDYSGLTGEEMWKRLDGKLTSGSIILMHNGTKHTKDSLKMIINNIKNDGYKIVPVSELIYKENYYIDVNGMKKNV